MSRGFRLFANVGAIAMSEMEADFAFRCPFLNTMGSGGRYKLMNATNQFK